MKGDPRVAWDEIQKEYDELVFDLMKVKRELSTFFDKFMALNGKIGEVQTMLCAMHDSYSAAIGMIDRDIVEHGPAPGSTLETYGSLKKGIGGAE